MDADRYTIVLRKERDGDGWAWVARVPELPGCAATEDTPEEVLAHIKESIESYVELEREAGRPIPAPYGEPSGKFTLRVPRWVHRELKLQADAEGTSLNHYVSSILTYWAGFGQPPRQFSDFHRVSRHALGESMSRAPQNESGGTEVLMLMRQWNRSDSPQIQQFLGGHRLDFLLKGGSKE